MHPDLATRRRLLVVTYRGYIDADRAWVAAASEARSWFPLAERPVAMVIGDPGSRLRSLYDMREKALMRLQAARAKLAEAEARLDRKRAVRVRLLLARP